MAHADTDAMNLLGNQGLDFTIDTPRSPSPLKTPQPDCSDICEKLILTYNASLIDMLGPELRTACIKEAKKCADSPTWRGTEKRNVLAKLIENYIDAKKSPKSTPRYIEGPLNISCHWSQDFQKLIYIFGEFHGNEKDCDKFFKPTDEVSISIENFLEEYFLNPIAFTDFLVEIESNVGGYKDDVFFENNGNRLARIKNLFKECVDSTTRRENEKCNFSRMHYFDIRRGEVKSGENMDGTIIISLSKSSKFLDDAVSITKDDDIVPDEDTLAYFLQDTINFTVKKLKDFYNNNVAILTVLNNCHSDQINYADFFMTEFKQYYFLKKEIDRSKKYFLDLRIEEFIEKQIIDLIIKKRDDLKELEKNTKIFMEAYNKILIINSQYEILKEEEKKKIYDEFKKIQPHLKIISRLVMPYNALLADSYVLARIFKKFDIDTEDSNKKRPTDEPQEPHNIIIYSGYRHSQVYRKFLIQLGFEDKGTGGTGIMDDNDIPKDGFGPRYCVDMKNITQPLFSRLPSPFISHSPPPMSSPPPPSISHSPPHRSSPPPPRPPPSISHSPPSPQQELPKRSKVLFSFSKRKVDFEPKTL